MGIDPMNNISNNNKNTLCSYIISTLAKEFEMKDMGLLHYFLGLEIW
jgi:hypothetical protein